ncbi:hypothetical protein JYQ62_06745 [Nostoc sp. UHCC 0702]|nr:hypothetical protein JYQ62_06745 [Nostoc sp. UHCC 0702]
MGRWKDRVMGNTQNQLPITNYQLPIPNSPFPIFTMTPSATVISEWCFRFKLGNRWLIKRSPITHPRL